MPHCSKDVALQSSHLSQVICPNISVTWKEQTTHRGETWKPHTKTYIIERIININCRYLVFIWLWKDTDSFWVLLNCGFRCWKVASSDECFHMPFNTFWVFHPLIWVKIPLLISTKSITQPLELQVCSDSVVTLFPGRVKILGSLFKTLTFLREEPLPSYSWRG